MHLLVKMPFVFNLQGCRGVLGCCFLMAGMVPLLMKTHFVVSPSKAEQYNLLLLLVSPSNLLCLFKVACMSKSSLYFKLRTFISSEKSGLFCSCEL